MDLNKKKYTKEEVLSLIKTFQNEYETKLNNQKERLIFLLEENKTLNEQIEEYRKKDLLISSTLVCAKEKAEEIENNAKLKYSLIVEELKKFSIHWKLYFNFLKEKYPNYSTLQKAVKLKEQLDKNLQEKNDDVIISQLQEKFKSVTDGVDFNPKEKIGEFIAATSENGFNIEEVLNPGELELEDLCKELGLME